MEILSSSWTGIKTTEEIEIEDTLHNILTNSKFKYVVGKTYKTQEGKKITVLGRTKEFGYGCLVCSDGVFRYDRSNNPSDAGRVAGSNHNYKDPRNLRRSTKYVKK